MHACSVHNPNNNYNNLCICCDKHGNHSPYCMRACVWMRVCVTQRRFSMLTANGWGTLWENDIIMVAECFCVFFLSFRFARRCFCICLRMPSSATVLVCIVDVQCAFIIWETYYYRYYYLCSTAIRSWLRGYSFLFLHTHYTTNVITIWHMNYELVCFFSLVGWLVVVSLLGYQHHTAPLSLVMRHQSEQWNLFTSLIYDVSWWFACRCIAYVIIWICISYGKSYLIYIYISSG